MSRETFTFDRVDRLTDILYGVAAASGLIEYDPLGKRVGMRPDRLGYLLGQVSRKSVTCERRSAFRPGLGARKTSFTSWPESCGRSTRG
jgi:hypothetical protein